MYIMPVIIWPGFQCRNWNFYSHVNASIILRAKNPPKSLNCTSNKVYVNYVSMCGFGNFNFVTGNSIFMAMVD